MWKFPKYCKNILVKKSSSMTYILKPDGDNNWLGKQGKLRINGKKKDG